MVPISKKYIPSCKTEKKVLMNIDWGAGDADDWGCDDDWGVSQPAASDTWSTATSAEPNDIVQNVTRGTTSEDVTNSVTQSMKQLEVSSCSKNRRMFDEYFISVVEEDTTSQSEIHDRALLEKYEQEADNMDASDR